MSHQRRRRLPALAATSALIAAFLPGAMGTATAATAVARDTDTGCDPDRVPSAGFSDTQGTFFEHEIDCVAWYGVASGNNSGGYSPNGKVTRGAMAKFLTNLLQAADELLDPTPEDAFDDDNGTAFELEINQLAGLGIFNGSRDSNDVDNDGDTEEFVAIQQGSVTRAQMASFINETHAVITGVKISSADDFFTDDDGTFHEPNINAIASVGIAAGKTQTTYAGNETITRAAMAGFLSREVDYLVEQGFMTPPVNGAADVLLDSKEINQGRAATGRIVTEEETAVTEALVDICGVEQDVTMQLDGNDFSFTIPFATPVGSCQLDFDIRLANNARELEAQIIEVLETDKVLAGPELVSIAVQTVGSETVTIRYEFNEEINPAVEASKFRLYGFAGTQFTASQATKIGDASVEATFTRDQYDDATTGGLDRFAVQDLDGLNNAEFGFGLKSKSLNAGETGFPDLTSVTGSGTTLSFTFDSPVYGAQAADFGAVYSVNGVTSSVAGTGITSGADGSATFTVTFGQPEGGVPVRGFIEADSIAGAPEGEVDNARQAEDVSGAEQGGSPHLKSVILDPTNNQVQLVFSEAVSSNAVDAQSPPACAPPLMPCAPGRGASIYDINGDEFYTTDIEQGSPNTLIAQFGDGEVTGLIQGASIDQDLAEAQRNPDLKSGVDEVGRQNTFAEGRTAAPDLVNVSRTTDADGNLRVVFTFDQIAELSDSATGDLVLYAADNSRLSLIQTEDGTISCTENGAEIVCIIQSEADGEPNPAFAFASGARYAAATYSVVTTGGDTNILNPEGGRQL